MRKFLVLPVLLAAFVLPALLSAADSLTPQIRLVEPVTAQAGDTVKVVGENLGPASVAALYLTDGKNDTKVEIIEATSTSIAFKVPAGVNSGRLALMVLTTGPSPKLLEEPVKVTIE
jgi:IPT/TIG domain